MAGGDRVGRHAGVVEREQRVLPDDEAAAAGPLLKRGRLLDELRVVAEEVVPGLPVALDEGVPDEQFPGEYLVDAVQEDGPVGDDRDPVQGDFLGGDGAALRA